MSRLLRVLIAVAIAAPLLVSTGGPAVACSCVSSSPKELVKEAGAIVAGHVVGEQPLDPMYTQSTVAVDGVYKGRVAATIALVANIGSGGGSSCAVLYPVGSKVDPLVLSRSNDGTYAIQPCALLSLPQVPRGPGRAQTAARCGRNAEPVERAPPDSNRARRAELAGPGRRSAARRPRDGLCCAAIREAPPTRCASHG